MLEVHHSGREPSICAMYVMYSIPQAMVVRAEIRCKEYDDSYDADNEDDVENDDDEDYDTVEIVRAATTIMLMIMTTTMSIVQCHP